MTRRFRLSPRRAVPVLIVLVLLGSALSLVLALTRPDPRPPEDLPGAGADAYAPAALAGPGGPAIEALARALPGALGYDFRTLDEGLAAATASMTRPFARRFRRSFNSSARPLATRQRSVVEARLLGVGQVRLVGDEEALGLAYVDQVLVEGNRLAPGVRARVLNRYRVLVRMVLVGEDWKIANISPV